MQTFCLLFANVVCVAVDLVVIAGLVITFAAIAVDDAHAPAVGHVDAQYLSNNLP